MALCSENISLAQEQLYGCIYFICPLRKQAAYKQVTRGPIALSPLCGTKVKETKKTKRKDEPFYHSTTPAPTHTQEKLSNSLYPHKSPFQRHVGIYFHWMNESEFKSSIAQDLRKFNFEVLRILLYFKTKLKYTC